MHRKSATGHQVCLELNQCTCEVLGKEWWSLMKSPNGAEISVVFKVQQSSATFLKGFAG